MNEKKLDKLTEEEAKQLVESDKARFVETKTSRNDYLIHGGKLYIKRIDGYFPHTAGGLYEKMSLLS